MENYFTHILDLINYISEKEILKSKINEELKQTKKEKSRYLDLICIHNAKLSELLLYEEERDAELKYATLPLGLVLLFIILNIFLLTSKIFNPKILLLIPFIALSFPICKRLSRKSKKKYAALRIKRKDIIEREKKKREKLLEKSKKLSNKEQELTEKLAELEKDIETKKEYKEKLQTEIIANLAPILDELISAEIKLNGNTEIQEILKRIREI